MIESEYCPLECSRHFKWWATLPRNLTILNTKLSDGMNNNTKRWEALLNAC